MGKHIESDFELNLTPIVDCFTVLITYLLISASFISLGMLSITVVAPSEESITTPIPPAITVTVYLKPQGEYLIETETPGASKESKTISDASSLLQFLSQIKEKFPTLETLLLTSDDQIEYKHIVKLVEKLKDLFPTIALRTN